MPLESCLIVIDNSEFMRNGDYAPDRFQAQAQAVAQIFTTKTDSNPETQAGLMTMAGTSPELLVTPTNDLGKLLSALNKARLGGVADFQTALQIAQLALKNRENKNLKQRIVAFVGSPLEESHEAMVRLGKRLRKNGVVVDVITIGEEGMANDGKLEAMVEAAGATDSHLISVPPGTHLLCDMIKETPVLYDPDRPAAGGEDGFGELDDGMDPELAMALRMSLQEAEEAAARERAAASASTSAAPPVTAIATEVSSSSAPIPHSAEPPTVQGMDSGGDEDEEELKRALAMSRGEDVAMGDEEDEEDEEAAIARAIAMSLEGDKEEQQDAKK